MLGVFPPAFWSLALRWHEEVGSVHWTEDQRSSPSLPPASDPAFHLSASAPVHLTRPSLPPRSGSCLLWLPPVQRRRCRVCAGVASNPGQTDSQASRWGLVWNKILVLIVFLHYSRSGCAVSETVDFFDILSTFGNQVALSVPPRFSVRR